MAAATLTVGDREYFHEDAQYSFNLNAATVIGDIGKAVEIDAAADMTVKLATDGGFIFGRLETFEDRKVEGTKIGTISTKGMGRFPVKAGALLIALGNSIIGAGAGEVKGVAAAANQANTIVKIDTGFVTVRFG